MSTEKPGAKPFSERVDPDGSTRRDIEHLRELDSPVGRAVFQWLGVDPALIDRLVTLNEQRAELYVPYERWTPFPKIGWAIGDFCPPDLYDAALELLTGGRQEEAETMLDEGWNRGRTLETTLNHVARVGILSETRKRIADRRYELLSLALADHRAGRFHASVPVVLAQIEGILRDVSSQTPFSNPSAVKDDVTPVGHESVLYVIFSLFGRKVTRTYLAAEPTLPLRHGVLHGRSLGYDNRLASTKLFVSLFAIVDFCQARLLEADAAGTLSDEAFDLS